MSDLKLFRITDGTAAELAGTSVALAHGDDVQRTTRKQDFA